MVDIAQGIVRVASSNGQMDPNVMLSPAARSPVSAVHSGVVDPPDTAL